MGSYSYKRTTNFTGLRYYPVACSHRKDPGWSSTGPGLTIGHFTAAGIFMWIPTATLKDAVDCNGLP
jgi:hypothetical protein